MVTLKMEQNMVERTVKHSSDSIYSKKFLAIYDFWVLGIVNPLAWKCPTKLQMDFYNQYVAKKHLDVGAGTGYFLNKCTFNTKHPEIHLLDTNRHCLASAAKRLQRYRPIHHCADVLEPLKIDLPKFESISVNCLL